MRRSHLLDAERVKRLRSLYRSMKLRELVVLLRTSDVVVREALTGGRFVRTTADRLATSIDAAWSERIERAS